MSRKPEESSNLPRDNSAAPSLVLFDVDANKRKNNQDPPDLEAGDKTVATHTNLLGQTYVHHDATMNTQADVSALGAADNQLMLGIGQQRSDAGYAQALPARRNSEPDDQPIIKAQYITKNMNALNVCIQNDSPQELVQLAKNNDIGDPEEALMLMYVSVVIMNTPKVFDLMRQKHQNFKTKPVWHVLFTTPRIFGILQGQSSMAERQKFDELVLKVALERNLQFITDKVLENAVITPQILSLLLQDGEQNMVIEMVTRDEQPNFFSNMQQRVRRSSRKHAGEMISSSQTKKMEFVDVVEAMIDLDEHTNADVIQMIGLMQLEVDRANKKSGQPYVGGDNDDKKLIDYEELFKLFLLKRKVKLLRYLFSLDRKLFEFHADLFLMALELEAYDMAALLFKEFFRLLRNLDPQQLEFVVTQVVQSYNKNNGMLDFKAYLARQYTEQMQLRHARALLDAIRNKVKTVSKQNILVLNLNVVKSSCLLIENLADLSLKFKQLKFRCSNIRKDIISLCQKYMDQVDSEYEMKYLLLEKDFEYRDSLDLITKHNIVEFLESQLSENVVKEIWRSAYATSDSILSASTNHMLTFKFQDCIRDLEYDQPFLKLKDVNQIEAHILQFTVWRFSPKARMLQEFFYTLFFCGVVDLYINAFLNLIPPLREFEEQLFGMEDKLAQISDKNSYEYIAMEAKTQALQYYFEPLRLQFYDEMMMFSYLCFAVLFFAIQHIPEIVYTTITRRQFNAYSFKNLLDFCMFAMFFSFICISYGNNLNGSWKEQLTIGEQDRADVYTRNFFKGAAKFEELLLLCCAAVFYFRLFYLFIYNTTFGTTWGIIRRLLPELMNYILFYFVEVFFFAMVAELAFRQLPLYNTFENAFYSLFYSGFGFFNYDQFEKESQFGYGFGMIFILGFLVCNLGLVTSIFTSVIVVLYDEFYKHKSIFTMLETLRVRPVMQADKEYSALISLPPPINGLLLFLAPFLMTNNNPELLNKSILWIAYLPILIMSFLLFTLYNVIILPITYVKMFFHKLVMIFVYSKSYRVGRADKFMLWIFFTMVGPFRLFANLIMDLVAFVQHCTLQDLKKTRVQIREKPLTKQTLQMASYYFKQRKERLIMFKQAAGELRDQMSIFHKIGQIFVPQPLINFMTNKVSNEAAPSTLLSENEFETVFKQIREYSTIKQILEGNSEQVVFNKQRVKSIDCQVMSVLFEDVLRHKTVSKIEDENYIFIRRAVDVKTRANIDRRREERQKLGSDVALMAAEPLTDADFEDRYKSEKRLKHAVRKLINLRTNRMLDILGYSTTEKDARRLEYAIKSFGSDNALLQKKLTQLSFSQPSIGGDGNNSLQGFFGAENSKALEERITQLGNGIPKLDSDLLRMQHEIQILVEHYTESNKVAQGAANREMQASNTIKNLHREMGQLRGASATEENSLSKFVQNDYFYKELSGRPKVSFVEPGPHEGQAAGKEADPVDSIMEQRPARGIPPPSARKSKFDKRKSFISNARLAPAESAHTAALAPITEVNRQVSEQKQQKRKTISLAQLKVVSKKQQTRASMAPTQPMGLFSKPGEDSDVPYISDNSGSGL